ncbi:meprin A subunit beta [Erinaceus europaeus]|uniref:Metalloendopeptidase n=1 Tax=Erinaceus europaeus TaxID=9365 RepID=A0A1S2ZL20_ERIEU|nr:meprin A subunit beta [Erinaceus europaeus]
MSTRTSSDLNASSYNMIVFTVGNELVEEAELLKGHAVHIGLAYNELLFTYSMHNSSFHHTQQNQQLKDSEPKAAPVKAEVCEHRMRTKNNSDVEGNAKENDLVSQNILHQKSPSGTWILQLSTGCDSMGSLCLPWFLFFVACLTVSDLSTAENFDLDGGIDQDIFDINEDLGLDLFEGDIKLDGAQDRNSIIGENYRWPQTIPYVLEDSLEINAKGVILNAFERYRLKTCIDFKPWAGEANYISVFKGSGCWSSVGSKNSGKQELSIGENCDRIGTVQHEFLHALGFWHEQSRSDRDDYVRIVWDRILSGKEHNFNTYSDQVSDSLNVPYDYTSVMHYSKTAFQNGTEPTIITRISGFMDVIGQRMDFSESDLTKLSRLYNCSSSLSFMDSCDFELENICGMIQSSEDDDDWKRLSQAPLGPESDHSNMDQCKDFGFFMHFNSGSVNVGAKALLESRILYPKRGFQCLQFYLYNSRKEPDQLNIYIREYSASHVNGSLTLVKEIKDIPIGRWQLYHVTLNVTNKFRVVLEGLRGPGTSLGGLSIDDINLSETRCPHHIWHIRNFTQFISSTNVTLESPPFYSSKGYAFQVTLDLSRETNAGIYFSLISGANDDQLQWPCSWLQATMTLLDQNPDIRRSMSNQRSVTTDPLKTTGNGDYFWDKPSKVGQVAVFPNGTQYRRNTGYGTSAFITYSRLRSRDYIKGDDVYILLTVEDISHLNSTQMQPNPVPTSGGNKELCKDLICENGGICTVQEDKAECRCPSGKDWWYIGEKCEKRGSTRDIIIIATSSTVAVFAVMLIVTLVSVYCTKKKYNKETSSNSTDTVLENVQAF